MNIWIIEEIKYILKIKKEKKEDKKVENTLLNTTATATTMENVYIPYISEAHKHCIENKGISLVSYSEIEKIKESRLKMKDEYEHFSLDHKKYLRKYMDGKLYIIYGLHFTDIQNNQDYLYISISQNPYNAICVIQSGKQNNTRFCGDNLKSLWKACGDPEIYLFGYFTDKDEAICEAEVIATRFGCEVGDYWTRSKNEDDYKQAREDFKRKADFAGSAGDVYASKNRDHSGVYMIEFDDGRVYVGQADKAKARILRHHAMHNTKTDTPVLHLMIYQHWRDHNIVGIYILYTDTEKQDESYYIQALGGDLNTRI